MRVLFDQGTPVPLRRALTKHDVTTAHEKGWQLLGNGDLLAAAEAAGFDAIVTTDKNLRYQQNLTNRQLAIRILPTTDWRRIKMNADAVATAVDLLKPADFVELAFTL